MYSAKCLSPVQSSRNGKNPNSILDFMRYTQLRQNSISAGGGYIDPNCMGWREAERIANSSRDTASGYLSSSN